ncbi:BTB domain-containing protein [Mycena venus]|uniref:BTB domain-containing protein n=1 Tax=Mycena venus TaxID=2733690 RepID=A0A8H6XT67_9AGAR|nr:BTB domain-containing protein [Mycena venus]
MSFNAIRLRRLLPVQSLSDAGYSPIRVIEPAAGDVFLQTDLTGALAFVGGTVTTVDGLFDVIDMVNPTLELVNVETGFSTSPQSLADADSQALLLHDGGITYATDNVTLNPGTWKMRVNFTGTGPGSTGKFSALSDEFFLIDRCPVHAGDWYLSADITNYL